MRLSQVIKNCMYRVIIDEVEATFFSCCFGPLLPEEVPFHKGYVACTYRTMPDRILVPIDFLLRPAQFHGALADLKTVGVVSKACQKKHIVSSSAAGYQRPLPTPAPFFIMFHRARAYQIPSIGEQVHQSRVRSPAVPRQEIALVPQLRPTILMLCRIDCKVL